MYHPYYIQILTGTEVMGTRKKAINNKNELALQATTPDIPTAQIIYIQIRNSMIYGGQRRLCCHLFVIT